MTERAAYSRVYWSIVDDAKFAAIYDDDRHLATWLRLLLVADQSHPASANIPTGTRRASVAALSAAGLIDLGTGSRYRIHGLDAERERRRIAATSRGQKQPEPSPSGHRPVPEPSPNGPDTTGLSRGKGETSRDETTARATVNDPWDDPEHDARVWLSEHGCAIRPGNGYDQKLVTAVQAHGVNAVVGMFDRLALAGTRNGDVKGFLFGAIDALDSKTRPNLGAMEKADAILERATATHRRTMDQMWARRIERYRNTGEWDEAWGAPPSKEGVSA
jgi:hypothetical protein